MNKKNVVLALVIAILVGVVGYFALSRQSLRNDSFVGKWDVASVERDGVQLVNRSNASIEFLNNGTYKALDGCNDMAVSSYKASPDGKLSFQVGGTKKKCADNIVEFWDLGKVRSYQLIDDSLILNYKTDDGAEGVFKLQRTNL